MGVREVRTRITQHEILRRHKGLSVSGLAQSLDVTHGYVSQIEGHRIPASPKYREAVTDLFGVDEALIFDDEGWVR